MLDILFSLIKGFFGGLGKTFFDRGGGFLEVYAGSGRFSCALRERGVRTLPA